MLCCFARFSILHLQVVFRYSIPIHFRHLCFQTKHSLSLSDFTFFVPTYKSHLVNTILLQKLTLVLTLQKNLMKRKLNIILNFEQISKLVEHQRNLIYSGGNFFKPIMRSINYASLRRRQCSYYRQRGLL